MKKDNVTCLYVGIIMDEKWEMRGEMLKFLIFKTSREMTGLIIMTSLPVDAEFINV